jgi:hypothetical protein
LLEPIIISDHGVTRAKRLLHGQRVHVVHGVRTRLLLVKKQGSEFKALFVFKWSFHFVPGTTVEVIVFPNLSIFAISQVGPGPRINHHIYTQTFTTTRGFLRTRKTFIID